jgi:superoxide dismutase, Cu-Zn family
MMYREHRISAFALQNLPSDIQSGVDPMKLTSFRQVFLSFTLPGLMISCQVGYVDRAPVSATLQPTAGNTVTGTVTFSQAGDKVKMDVSISGATPGSHGLHIHETADCSDPKGMSAGAHWNPNEKPHGLLLQGASHLGDLGNIEIDASGNGEMTFIGPWTLGTGNITDVIGRGVIFHAATDDTLPVTPTGNAGARQACAEIK